MTGIFEVGAKIRRGLGLWVGAPPAAPPPDPGNPFQWGRTGWCGGGHTNLVLRFPDKPERMLALTDVDGGFRTWNDAVMWDSFNAFVMNSADAGIAGGCVNPDAVNYPGHAVIVTGLGSLASSAAWVTMDYGDTWALLFRGQCTFHGNNTNGSDLPQPHPRSTGRLVGINPANHMYFFCSLNGGIYRAPWDASTGLTTSPPISIGFKSGGGGRKNGVAWPTDGMLYHLRCIAIDPSDPDHIIVSDQARNAGSSANYSEGHVWRCKGTDANGPRGATPNWEEFAGATFNRAAGQGGSPLNVQDLRFDRLGNVYGIVSAPITWNGGLIGGSGSQRDPTSYPAENYPEQGLYRLASPKTAALTANWRIFIAANSPANRMLNALDVGTDNAGNDRILVLCTEPSDYMVAFQGDASGGDCFATNDGVWKHYVANNVYGLQVLDDLGGTKRHWWQYFTPSGGKDQFAFRNSPWTHIEFSKLDFNDFVTGGRIFRCKDAGAASPHLRPYTDGTGQLNVRDIVSDRRKPNRLYAGASDAGFLVSVDGGTTPITMKRAATGSPEVYALAVDPDDSTVYLASGDDTASGKPGNTYIYKLDNIDAIEAAFVAGNRVSAGLIATYTEIKTMTEPAFGADAVLSCIALDFVKDTSTGDKWLVALIRSNGANPSGGGVYRWKVAGSGPLTTWSKSATGTIMRNMGSQSSTGSKRAFLGQRPGSSVAWAFERKHGLYRTDDFHATLINVHSSTTDAYGQGSLAIHPDTDNIVFVSRPDGVYQIGNGSFPASAMTAGAGNVGQPGVTFLFKPAIGAQQQSSNPGAICVDPVHRLLIMANLFGGPSRIFACSLDVDMTNVANWKDVSGSGIGSNQAWGIEDMVADTGSLYTACKGGSAGRKSS